MSATGNPSEPGEPGEGAERAPTPEEWDEFLRNSLSPEQFKESMARLVALSKRYDEALRQAEHGLRELLDIARSSEEGMADSAARELVRILSNTLLAINSPQAAPGKDVIWAGEGPNPQPNWMSDPVWPEPFKKQAREREDWPVLYHVHPERHERQTRAPILGFEVGKNVGINTRGKPFSFTTANIIVLQLKDFIDRYRGREFRGDVTLNYPHGVSTIKNADFKALIQSFASLPRLSRAPDVLKAWRKAGNELLPFMFGNELERSANLKGLLTGKKTETGEPGAMWNGKAWWQRDLIRKAVSKAWKSVAADD